MEETKRPLVRKRWFYRFSLASFLLFVAIVAGYFSGYRLGWQQFKQDQQDTTISTRSYKVADLIKPIDAKSDWSAADEDFAALTELITSTIGPSEWSTANGSTASIVPFVQDSSMQVTCTGSTHDGLSKLLQQLRDLRYKLPGDYLKTVREVAGRKIPARRIIKAFTATSPEDHVTMENHFSSGLNELTIEFGRPDQIASAGKHVIPNWLGSQRVAVWERGTGKLYFALVDCRPQGEALVVGWWEESVGPLKPIVLASNP